MITNILGSALIPLSRVIVIKDLQIFLVMVIDACRQAFGRLRQNHEFKASLGYIQRFSPQAKSNRQQLHVVAHACSSSAREAEAGRQSQAAWLCFLSFDWLS